MSAKKLGELAAPLLVGCLAAPAWAQTDPVSYIACSDGEIYRIGQNDFSEWDPERQVWDEKCFEGERLSRGGRPMRSECRIGAQEIRAENTFPGSADVSTWMISRVTGRLTFADSYRGTESFQCQKTERPDQGEAIF